jgi:hypothetical protein
MVYGRGFDLTPEKTSWPFLYARLFWSNRVAE